MQSSYSRSLAVLILLFPALTSCGAAPNGDATAESGTGGAPAGPASPVAEAPEDDTGIGSQLEALLTDVEPPQSYEMRSLPPGGEPSMSMIVMMGDKQPVKIKTMHEDGWMLVDLEHGGTYAFEPNENIIMKMPTGTSADVQMSPGDFVHPESTVIGKDRVDGVKCWVVESKVGPMESKVWIGTKDGLPRQFETEDGITRFLYSRIDEIADSEFDLPDGVPVMDMAAMMKQGFKQPR